jgi:hypothetical protein
MSSKKRTPRIWHEKHQEILKNWGESAACYRFMHNKSYERYKTINLIFTLPTIIIGTVTGTANFALKTFPSSSQTYITRTIGSLNLLSAIVTSVWQFLKIAELMESHRLSYIHYGKFVRFIKLEINLPVSQRTHHGANMIDICETEYNRLIEQCPSIPHHIMKQFLKKFPEKGSRDLRFNRPEMFTVKPFDEYPVTVEIDEQVFQDALSEISDIQSPQESEV